MAENFGAWLREQRKLARMTLGQLGQACGISEGYVSKIESGARRPSAEVVVRIAQALGMSAPAVLRRAGYLSDDAVPEVARRLPFEEYLRGDVRLTQGQRRQLLSLYLLFTRGESSGKTSDPR